MISQDQNDAGGGADKYVDLDLHGLKYDDEVSEMILPYIDKMVKNRPKIPVVKPEGPLTEQNLKNSIQ